MRAAVDALWPELAWIQDEALRDATAKTWERAFELSPLVPEDLEKIPFTLLVPGCPTTFMEHKRCVVHVSRRSAEAMIEHMGNALPVDMDTVIAGAILADKVCHIIAAHAGEGDMVKRTTEAYIVHHADFMTFLPFKNLAR